MEKDIKELMKQFEEMLEENPEKIVKFTKHLYQHNPEAIEKMLLTYKDDGHIKDKKTYRELVDDLEWSNKQGYGAKWTLEKIKKNAGVDFESVDFTEFDLAFLVNFLYSKCCKYTQDGIMLLKIAKGLLEDKHKQMKIHKGEPLKKHKSAIDGEKAYGGLLLEAETDYRRRYRNEGLDTDTMENLEEEDRRRRRYRYEDENPEIEDRRGRRRYRYRSEADIDDLEDESRYYKDSHVGFRSY